jgi:hypothetical protein
MRGLAIYLCALGAVIGYSLYQLGYYQGSFDALFPTQQAPVMQRLVL